jgi:twitching motility protein PilT
MQTIDQLLQSMSEARASDLHLKAGRPALIRVDGHLRPLSDQALTMDAIRTMQEGMFSARQLQRLEDEFELDASYQPATVSDRFRVNAFVRMGMPGMVLRRVPKQVPSLDELGFKPVLKEVVHGAQGLVLVTGPTGSGKSTTLAAMVRELNETNALHIVCIEDPIEFVQEDKQSVINQREVGIDTHSFAEALRRALRQDPDVILVGEMRDAETVQIAAMAAETGHLVLSTLHTNDAKQSIDRMINLFPGPIDEAWNQMLRPPKVAPKRIAQEILAALRSGVEDVYPGEIAQDWLERWLASPKTLERELARCSSPTSSADRPTRRP